jgi:uncharacterized membrane protein
MLPSPLHPAIVHFPIVLACLLPLAALAALWRIRRGAPARPAWLLTATAAGALTLSAWLAVETGERDEERAEDVVGEQTLDVHEEAAERFLALSGGVLVIAAAGLLGGRAGRIARPLALVAALGLVGAGYQVGHSGGRLVYGTAGAPGVGRIGAGKELNGGERSGGDERDVPSHPGEAER